VGDGTTQSGGFAGHCDWRLPTIAELRTIADTTVQGCGNGTPCINPIFGPTVVGVPNSLYWSATPSVADVNFIITVTFSNGSLASAQRLAGEFARAVRGGK
jgi:hypothetical protein